MNCGELQQYNFTEESLATSLDTTSDYSKFFNLSLTLYNGLTQEEILNLQRCITVQNHPSQQTSFKVSKRSRLKNCFKQSFQRIQKNKKNRNNWNLFKTLETNCTISDKSDHLDNDWDLLSCYNYFKTEQLSLLFDISMNENSKRIKNDYQLFNKEGFSMEQPNQKLLSVKKFKVGVKNNFDNDNEEDEEEILVPPLSSSTEKIIINKKKFKNFFKDNQSTKQFLPSDQKFSTKNNNTHHRLFHPIQFRSTTSSFSRSASSSISSLLLGKHYSIPTFKEKRKQLTVPKIVGNLLNGSFDVNSQRNPTLSYQNVDFYSNIPSYQSDNISTSSTPSSPVYISNFTIENPSKIKFEEKSSLFIYGNFTKPTHFHNNQSLNLKPILKNTINKRQNIELKNAEGCDRIDMDKFLQDIIDNEEKRPFDSTQSEMVRNRQLIRYYREETQNLIKDNYKTHHSAVATIELPINNISKISEKKRRLLGVTELDKGST